MADWFVVFSSGLGVVGVDAAAQVERIIAWASRQRRQRHLAFPSESSGECTGLGPRKGTHDR